MTRVFEDRLLARAFSEDGLVWLKEGMDCNEAEWVGEGIGQLFGLLQATRGRDIEAPKRGKKA